MSGGIGKKAINQEEIDLIKNKENTNTEEIRRSADYYRKQMFPALSLTQEDYEMMDIERAKVFSKERTKEMRNSLRPDLKDME